MASEKPDNGDAAPLFSVIARMTVPAESAAIVGSASQIAVEDLATTRTGAALQLEWLDAIEAALTDLSRPPLRDPALIEATLIARRLRTAITAAMPARSNRVLWLYLYGLISAPVLQHFSSAVGDDLGHATAHKIIDVLSSLSQHLKL